MYAYIKGTLEETGEDYIVVEAGGRSLRPVRPFSIFRPWGKR